MKYLEMQATNSAVWGQQDYVFVEFWQSIAIN